jgi:hypothetical protein
MVNFAGVRLSLVKTGFLRESLTDAANDEARLSELQMPAHPKLRA